MSDAAREIQNLVFGYAERIDLGDFEGVADLLAHADIRFEGGDAVTRGRDAVLQMYSGTTRRYDDCGTPKTKHMTSNLIVELDEAEGRATCRSYYVVFQQTPELPLQPIIAGRYHDEFERVDGAWRFSARRIFCDQFGDLSKHLLFDASRLQD